MTAADTVLQQFEAIRRSGKTNMMDQGLVQRIAYEAEYYQLVTWIEDHDEGKYIEMAKLSQEVGYGDMENLPVDSVPEAIILEMEL